MTVTVPGKVIGARDTLKPLADPAGVWASLPASLPAKPLDPAALTALIEEALRILGLLPMALGRGELATGVTGAGLIRQQLIALMILETEPPLPPGALHLARLISAQDLATVEALPGVVATRGSVIAANLAYAGVLLPRARAAAGRVGAVWPQALEAACARQWRRLDLELPGFVG
jgi:hypothetical protein